LSEKVCIVGFSNSTRDETPPIEQGWEYWGLNTLWKYVDLPWAKWFEMHTADYLRKKLGETATEYDEWLRSTDIPVYMLRNERDYPTSTTYPIDSVISALSGRFNSPLPRYFASTVAYAFGYAMTMEPEIKEIAVYGVDMVKEGEYGYQRPNMEYLIGLARGSGLKVTLPEKGALCTGQWMYGYEEPANVDMFTNVALAHSKRLKELDEDVKEFRRQMDDAHAKYFLHYGAYQEAVLWQEKLKDMQRGVGV
jgi:hypothetical protein